MASLYEMSSLILAPGVQVKQDSQESTVEKRQEVLGNHGRNLTGGEGDYAPSKGKKRALVYLSQPFTCSAPLLWGPPQPARSGQG